MNHSVLIVDDELDIQSSLSFALKDEGYQVFTASSPAEAEKILSKERILVGLFDIWFPEGDGLDLLKYAREHSPSSSFIMMSGHGNIELALKSIRLGAYDFLEKPLELEKVLVLLRNAAEAAVLKSENRALMSQLFPPVRLAAGSRPMAQLRADLEKAAATHAHVLLLGENGSGKAVAARYLHRASARSEKPFVTIHCAALSDDRWEEELFGHSSSAGRVEMASGGTLYLSGISELGEKAQARLVRLLEEKSFERVGSGQTQRFDARVIASSSRDLAQQVSQGRFREDLYFHLKVLPLYVPPLRDRAEDLPELAESFLHSLSNEYGRATPRLGADLLAWMRAYDWPGNVRELKNLIERMLILGTNLGDIGMAALPEELQSHAVGAGAKGRFQVKDPTGSLRELRAHFEASILEQRLASLGGNVTRAAESLGIERAHLHRKLKQYGINNDA
jgi:two-component system nitrogen regulation response regulator NtrX